MTSEAHKRNPPGSERWGAKARLLKPTEYEIPILAAAGGIGDPQLMEFIDDQGVRTFYCYANELMHWRAARTPSQAGEAQ